MSRELKDRFDKVDQKLDIIDNKLDDHLQRLTAAETAILFIKGHLKISLSVAIAIIGTLVVAYFKKINLIP